LLPLLQIEFFVIAKVSPTKAQFLLFLIIKKPNLKTQVQIQWFAKLALVSS